MLLTTVAVMLLAVLIDPYIRRTLIFRKNGAVHVRLRRDFVSKITVIYGPF